MPTNSDTHSIGPNEHEKWVLAMRAKLNARLGVLNGKLKRNANAMKRLGDLADEFRLNRKSSLASVLADGGASLLADPRVKAGIAALVASRTDAYDQRYDGFVFGACAGVRGRDVEAPVLPEIASQLVQMFPSLSRKGDQPLTWSMVIKTVGNIDRSNAMKRSGKRRSKEAQLAAVSAGAFIAGWAVGARRVLSEAECRLFCSDTIRGSRFARAYREGKGMEEEIGRFSEGAQR